jgi:diphosphomevalonate decarboxylase
MQLFRARANPNIAFIKYWGNSDYSNNIPLNGSISMNLEGLETITSVSFDAGLQSDHITINGNHSTDKESARVSRMLDDVRSMAGISDFACVKSENNFPTGAGIASSASAFASLAMAASAAAGLRLSEAALSSLARRGSGSACRSIPGGFVEWLVGTGDADSYATVIAPQNHWDLVDCIAVVSSKPKPVGSTEGHLLARTSPIQASRVADAPRRLDICRRAILERDFSAFAEILELDSNLMHAVMMTSNPPLFYWQPETLAIMQTVRSEYSKGIPVCCTVDAGPNVHVICTSNVSVYVTVLLESIPGVQKVRQARVGGPARLIDISA